MIISMQVKDNLIEFDDNRTSSSDANLNALQTKLKGTGLKFTVFQISNLFSKFSIDWVKNTTFLLDWEIKASIQLGISMFPFTI